MADESSTSRISKFRRIATLGVTFVLLITVVLAIVATPDFRETIAEAFSVLGPEPGVSQINNIAYADNADAMRTGDLYLPSPQPEKSLPVVVIVHGGSWSKGSKGDFTEVSMARFFVRHGFAAFVIDYRKVDGGGFPSDIVDIKNALCFLVANYQKWHLDPSRLFLVGTSSGASSVLVAAYTQHSGSFKPDGAAKETAFSVRALASISGPTDFSTLADNPYLQSYLHSEGKKPPDNLIKSASPVTYQSTAEPTIFVHGVDDRNVPIDHSIRLHDALARVHIPVSMIRVEGSGHFIGAVSRRNALEYVLRFFKENDPGS